MKILTKKTTLCGSFAFLVASIPAMFLGGTVWYLICVLGWSTLFGVHRDLQHLSENDRLWDRIEELEQKRYKLLMENIDHRAREVERIVR